MYLESYSQVGSEVKQPSLVISVEIEDKAESTTAKRYHACCLVVGLGNVLLEVFFIVQ